MKGRRITIHISVSSKTLKNEDVFWQKFYIFISILWILIRFQWIEKSAIAVPTLSESSYNVVMMKKTCLFFDIYRITNEADCSLFHRSPPNFN